MAVKKDFPADRASLGAVREFVRLSATDLHLERTDELVLAVSEACALLLRYTLNPVIRVISTVTDCRLEIRVEDDNNLHPLGDRHLIQAEESALIRELVDEFWIDSDGLASGQSIHLVTMITTGSKPGTEGRPATRSQGQPA